MTIRIVHLELDPQRIRDIEKALERACELHDEDCDCGACWLLDSLPSC